MLSFSSELSAFHCPAQPNCGRLHDGQAWRLQRQGQDAPAYVAEIDPRQPHVVSVLGWGLDMWHFGREIAVRWLSNDTGQVDKSTELPVPVGHTAKFRFCVMRFKPAEENGNFQSHCDG
jgi:hypothetical protein